MTFGVFATILLLSMSSTAISPVNICGLLAQPPRVLASDQQIPVSLRVNTRAVRDMSRRYPIAATFVAVMASKAGSPSVFDAGNVTLGIRHRPREGTAEAFLERGDVAMQAPFVTELPLFEQVLVEVRGEKRASGELEWWVLSSHETRKGTRVLEGPVRIVLADTGERAAASMGNMGVLAPVMEIASVE